MLEQPVRPARLGAVRAGRADAAVARLDAGRARALRPAARGTRARPVRRAGRQDDAPRGADGWRGRGRGRRARPAARAGDRAQLPSGSGSRIRRGRVGRRGRAGVRGRLRPGARRPPVLGPGNAAVPARRALAQAARPRSTELAALQARILDAGAEALQARGAARLLDLHHQPERRTRARSAAFSHDTRSSPPIDLSAPYPELSAAGGVVLQTLPHRDGTDGFFIAASRGPGRREGLDGERDATRPASRQEKFGLGPECPGCGEPWLRPTQLPGATAASTAWCAIQLMSHCPDCGEHSTIVRMSDRRTITCVRCGGSMLKPV